MDLRKTWYRVVFVPASAVSLMRRYNDPRVVIPVKAGIQVEKTGFRIKSGMTGV
jgi:hypothetical protein